jgi:signal transduction histidine kinase
LQNAINYTSEGGMVSLSAETVYNNMLVIQVSDSGNGIPREEHDKIFRKYYRSSAVKGIKGNGIGLAIVKEVATAHGGCVELESIEGVGSTFTLYLPV